MFYKIIYSFENEPDLTEVNEWAEEGWLLIQVGSSPMPGTEKRWFYVMQTHRPQPKAK